MGLEVDVAHQRGSFSLEAAFRTDGRLTALFGTSGSGKTTLVDVVAGLVQPSRGVVRIDGTTLLDTAAGVALAPHRRGIGYVFQEGRLFPHLTVRQNLLFGRVFARARRPGAASLDAVVALLGLDALLARRPGGLSGGEKQRVAIGRALLAQPRLLLMDEPLASLDEGRKAAILPFVERLRDEAGIPVVYVSHALAEVARLADTVVLLEAGRVVAAGATAAVLDGRLDRLPRGGEAGAVLEGRVVAHDARYGLSRLATPAGDLHVPGLAHPVGALVRALVRARDVIVAVEEPLGLSALNVLPGTIVAVDQEAGPDGAPWSTLRIACGAAHLTARVTRRSADELGLAPGRPVFAAVKSVSLDPRRP